ncbi:MAG: hypothetical protein R6X02_17485 [Enhygromyxa sp.]
MHESDRVGEQLSHNPPARAFLDRVRRRRPGPAAVLAAALGECSEDENPTLNDSKRRLYGPFNCPILTIRGVAVWE